MLHGFQIVLESRVAECLDYSPIWTLSVRADIGNSFFTSVAHTVRMRFGDIQSTAAFSREVAHQKRDLMLVKKIQRDEGLDCEARAQDLAANT